MNRKAAAFVFGIVILSIGSVNQLAAQDKSEPADSLWHVELPDVVVTATKGVRALQTVPIPTSIISNEEVRSRGAHRVSELLAEQTGLALVQDLGTGVQLQGLDAAYTLILIDGEPVIGREGGTLDLDRLTVAGLERIEIVRGPLSSLYGSEALAGVINIITREPENGLQGYARVSYETHNTMDVAASADIKQNKIGARFLFNRFSSNGYDLFPDLIGLTVPGFTDYTGSAKLVFEQSEKTNWQLNTRFGKQDQNSSTGLFLSGILVEFDEEASRTDWSIAPQLTHQFTPAIKLTSRLYAAQFNTESILRDRLNSENIPGETNFDQAYRKGEVQLDAVLGTQHIATIGSGYIGEQVKADRVRGGLRANYDVYGFVQHEWLPNEVIDLITSARLDVHSDYAARLSPKAAIMVKPTSKFSIRASVGSGFKAPTFQQLYMDFTNPAAGYSVLGSVDIRDAIEQLESQGQIQYFLSDPALVGVTRPESAIAYNLGFDAALTEWADVQVNLFRNNVNDLIETLPVAVKANGQSVFTYVNLNRIYTQGLNTEVSFNPFSGLAITLGYQYLDAKDRDVKNSIAEGAIYKRVNGRDRLVRTDEYGGLFNRSKHSGVVRLSYRYPAQGLTASLRAVVRGRYGYNDRNGNLILDDDSEYVDGYTLLNATVTKEIGASIEAQFGVKNGSDELNPEFIPSLSGRLFFASLRYTLNP